MTLAKLSAKQKLLLKWCHMPATRDKYDAVICDGAVRSGKTVVMITSFILWAMKNYNGASFGICGKTVRSAERNIINPLHQIADLTEHFSIKYTRSVNVLEISYANVKNCFYIFGGKDEGSYMLIQGITLSGVMFDEVALMPQSFVDQAIARTLSVQGARLWFNCNPESPSHWFYKGWVKSPEKHNALHLHFLMEDNPTLTKEQLDRAEAMFTGVFYKRYILGEWTVAEGAIYQIYSENKQRYYTDSPDFDYIQVGIDFGGNKSAHTFAAAGLKYDCSKLTVLGSERHTATGLSPDDLYRLLEAFIEWVNKKYGRVTAIYADSAEQTLINGIKARLDIPVRNSIKNPIIDRIRATTCLMAEGRFFITRDCESLEKAFETAVYDNKRNDIRLDDGTSDIDSLDAFEYSWEKQLRQYVRWQSV